MVIQVLLIVEGEKNKVVVFTSINDSLYSETAVKMPEQFDWNGTRKPISGLHREDIRPCLEAQFRA
jgi:hypothetical protein